MLRTSADVPGAAFFSQQHLFLPLPKPGFAVLGAFGDTAVTTHAFFKFGALKVLWRKRHAAGIAQAVFALLQPVFHRDTAVKHKTFAIPCAFRGRNILEVFQDATLQVVHVLYPFTEQIVGRFFAPNAAGAKHGHPFVVKPVLVLRPPGRELAKRFCLRVNGPLKGADLDLVVIAGVDQHNIVLRDQIVPVFWLDVISHIGRWINLGLPHGHDFFLEFHFHPQKRWLVSKTFLVNQRSTARQRPDMGQNRVNTYPRSCNGAVDALTRNQQRSLDPLRIADSLKRALQMPVIGKTGEVIKSGYNMV